MVLITCTMSQTSVHSSSGTLSDLIPWIYLSLPLYNRKGFDLGQPEWSRGFPYFLQLKSEFCNKEFKICARVSSQAFFCWLYRTSPPLAAKNIINLILVLTIWWCPHVESSLVVLEEVFCYDQCNLVDVALKHEQGICKYFLIALILNEKTECWLNILLKRASHLT